MLYLAFFVLSALLTYGVRAYARYRHILDIPNHRSSHVIPTPRGGGIAIIVVFYIGVLYFKDTIDTQFLYALFSSLPVAVISLLDDIVSVSSKIRLLVQSFSALLVLYFLEGVDTVDLLFFEVHSWWLNFVAFIFILWVTNLYNFLDGIDGYAASQAVLVGLGIALIFGNPLGGVITAASLGFLLFNWQKASIFMGDVGSATLGFIFAVFVLSDIDTGNIYIWSILLSLFWFDATVTLIRRYRNKENLTHAHRKHAYQRLVQSGWSHQRVVIFSIAFNLVFLLLLFFYDKVLFIFAINIVALCSILYYIDKKKSFR